MTFISSSIITSNSVSCQRVQCFVKCLSWLMENYIYKLYDCFNLSREGIFKRDLTLSTPPYLFINLDWFLSKMNCISAPPIISDLSVIKLTHSILFKITNIPFYDSSIKFSTFRFNNIFCMKLSFYVSLNSLFLPRMYVSLTLSLPKWCWICVFNSEATFEL